MTKPFDLVQAVEALKPLHDALQAANRARFDGKMSWPEYHAVCAKWNAAEKKVKQAFAASRGWKRSRSQFTLEHLRDGKRRCRGGLPGDCGIDHPNWFSWANSGGRPAALVVHVYGGYDACYALAGYYGLVFEPLPASWYYPGGSLAGMYLRRQEP